MNRPLQIAAILLIAISSIFIFSASIAYSQNKITGAATVCGNGICEFMNTNLGQGDSYIFQGQTIIVNSVDTTSATVSVDGVSGTLTRGSSSQINGLWLTLQNVGTDMDCNKKTANIIIENERTLCPQDCTTYGPGSCLDDMIGEFGYDIYNAGGSGSCTLNNSLADKCIDDNTLLEYFCSADRKSCENATVTCPQGYSCIEKPAGRAQCMVTPVCGDDICSRITEGLCGTCVDCCDRYSWSFDEGSGGTTNLKFVGSMCSTPKSLSGTINGATWSTDAACGSSYALNFNGIDNYVDTNFYPGASTGYVIVEAWIKPNSIKDQYIASKSDEPHGWSLKINSAGNIEFTILGGKTVSNTAIIAGNWYYIVGKWDGSTSKIYINGALDATGGKGSGTYWGGGNVSIGRYGYGASGYFDGIIDEVFFWQYADYLTDARIAARNTACGRAYCGDGTCQANENCSSCSKDCGFCPGCGDEILDAGEQCDDGNTLSGDGCSSTCQLEMPSIGNRVGYWRFEETSETIIADLSGNRNNGVISGATRTANGKCGNALSFNGVTNYASIPNSPSLQVSAPKSAEAWVFINSRPASGVADIVRKSDDLSLYLYPDGSVSAVVAPKYGTGHSAPLSLGAWHYVVIVGDGSTLKLYVDGVESASISVHDNLPGSGNGITIGGNPWDGQFYRAFNGIIDEVAYWNKALTAQEITDRYNNPCQAPAPICTDTDGGEVYDVQGTCTESKAGLSHSDTCDSQSVVEWSCTIEKTCKSTEHSCSAEGEICVNGACVAPPVKEAEYRFENGTAIDTSGNNNAGTIFGATLTADAACGSSKALSFNGVDNYITIPSSSSITISRPLTVEARIKINALPSYEEDVLSKAGNYRLTITTAGTVGFWKGDGVGWWGGSGGGPLAPNTWYHVAGTIDDAGTLRIYVNGQLVASRSGAPSNSDATTPLYIGSFRNDIYFFNGIIDEVRIWNAALTDAQLQEIYTSCPSCGNGKLELGEQCDDSNTLSGDDCSPACQIEPPECAPTETVCALGIDEDCDGLIDCADPDCAPRCNVRGGAHTIRDVLGEPQSYCGDGNCSATESSVTCCIDCGCREGQKCVRDWCEAINPNIICGNNKAEEGEECDGTDASVCPGLCKSDCTCKYKVGDKICQSANGETAQNSPNDCYFIPQKKTNVTYFSIMLLGLVAGLGGGGYWWFIQKPREELRGLVEEHGIHMPEGSTIEQGQNFVNVCKQEGYSDLQIKILLSRYGWPDTAIGEVFGA